MWSIGLASVVTWKGGEQSGKADRVRTSVNVQKSGALSGKPHSFCPWLVWSTKGLVDEEVTLKCKWLLRGFLYSAKDPLCLSIVEWQESPFPGHVFDWGPVSLPPVMGMRPRPAPISITLSWPNDWLKDEHMTQVGQIRVKPRTCPGATQERISLFLCRTWTWENMRENLSEL